MTTINTIQDFLRVMDEHPEWREEVRVRLLSRELLELPEKFAAFVAEMQEFKAEMRGFQKEANQRFDRIESRQDELAARQDEFATRQDEFAAKQDEFAAAVKRMDTNLSDMKGAFAVDRTVRSAGAIALLMNLERVADVGEEALIRMTLSNDIADIPEGDIESFRGADLVIQAVNQDGAECYIAVEVSYTANRRDAERATRHAALLTRFTGKPAYPVVAAVEVDRRIRPLLRSGDLTWHKLHTKLWNPH